MSPTCALVLMCAPKDTYHIPNAIAPASVPSLWQNAVSFCPPTGECGLLSITPIRCCLCSAHCKNRTSRLIHLYFIWWHANSNQRYPDFHCIFTWMLCDKSSFQCPLLPGAFSKQSELEISSTNNFLMRFHFCIASMTTITAFVCLFSDSLSWE